MWDKMFLVLLSLNPDVHLYAVAMPSSVSVQSVTVDRALVCVSVDLNCDLRLVGAEVDGLCIM
jgi:hypothetical protein